MRHHTAALGLIALALAGCATGRPPEIDYLAPTGVAPTARSAVIAQDPDLVIGNLVDRLQQENFKITHLDEQAGDVVAQYSGDPTPYVDCGWIVTYRTGGLERVPAASASSTFAHMFGKRELELKRDLRLDSRMVVRFDRQGSETVVSPTTTYVLTKTVDAIGSDGVRRGQSRETISFDTGESGKFSKGTVCQPNGQLEGVVLDSLPANSVVRAEPRAPVVASEPLQAPPAPPAAAPGPAPAAPPVRTASNEPAEELLRVLAPYSGEGGADGLQVATAGRDTRLHEGEDLILDVFLPRSARYLYLGYLQHDGRVGYITTMPVKKWAEDTGAIRYQTGFQISPPFGREMIVAVASTKPLFDEPRPGFEPAADYIAAVRQRLAALEAGGGTVAASHLFITTEPAGSS
jgi:hypothetical protein